MVLVLIILYMGYAMLNSEIESLNYEEWTVKVPVKLENGAQYDNAMAQVRLKPPDPCFETDESLPGVKVMTLTKVPVRKGKLDELPKLAVWYPSYTEEEVALAPSLSPKHPVYDTTNRLIEIHDPVVLHPSVTVEGPDYNPDGN